MAADGGGQAVLGSEDVHGAGFAVVAAEDGGAGTHVGWKRIVTRGEALDHLRPAEAVGEDLRQGAGELFRSGVVGSKGGGVGVVPVWRQNGEYDGPGGETENEEEIDEAR